MFSFSERRESAIVQLCSYRMRLTDLTLPPALDAVRADTRKHLEALMRLGGNVMITPQLLAEMQPTLDGATAMLDTLAAAEPAIAEAEKERDLQTASEQSVQLRQHRLWLLQFERDIDQVRHLFTSALLADLANLPTASSLTPHMLALREGDMLTKTVAARTQTLTEAKALLDKLDEFVLIGIMRRLENEKTMLLTMVNDERLAKKEFAKCLNKAMEHWDEATEQKMHQANRVLECCRKILAAREELVQALNE
jgi:hypothetical protein